jgi:hypothetical protein
MSVLTPLAQELLCVSIVCPRSPRGVTFVRAKVTKARFGREMREGWQTQNFLLPRTAVFAEFAANHSKTNRIASPFGEATASRHVNTLCGSFRCRPAVRVRVLVLMRVPRLTR